MEGRRYSDEFRYSLGAASSSWVFQATTPNPAPIYSHWMIGAVTDRISVRAKFGRPETKYKDARACVTGKITSYRGKPEIIATELAKLCGRSNTDVVLDSYEEEG